MLNDIRISMLLKIVNNVFETRLNNASAGIDLTAAQCDILGFIHHHSERKINPIDKIGRASCRERV